ncbi:cutinase family protein [Nocardia huaxiensis]|uniref:Cutinase family protein n=1 Tax=Nocardia huaxiensis TaxID=2755382 RepID=A0A7D6ZEW0_9NOCA|nr:cutinase family protein [Nocardia huaxiensis]QLY31958.1 cutinase family protein [Nocardia huaxiensis]UFS95529.1 cutinase family protein [Nocardia huaxiensis]
MALRNVLTRARLGSPLVAGPAALGVVAIVGATLILTTSEQKPQTADPLLVSSVTECHDMVTISIAGRNDAPQQGSVKMLVDANGNELPAALTDDYQSRWLDPIANAPKDDVADGSYSAVYISYPANMSTYEDAVNTGVTNTKEVMRQISQACPDTRFSIVGYSEGADVARRVAMGIGNDSASDGYEVTDPKNVVGVVILADAGRGAGEGPFVGATDPNHPDGYGSNYGGTGASGQGALPGTGGDFGALNGKVASFCSDGDLTCSAPKNISLLNLAANVGRQINVDALQNEGLTPATGQDVATVLAKTGFSAFEYISNNPGWWTSNETFLDVLLKVSDPSYKPGQPAKEVSNASSISTNEMSPLAYLPQKVFNEIVGLIMTNTNTIPVIMSDPYQQTLGEGTGHHFDYWNDADPASGKNQSSAEYAAAWLTHLAKQAQAGEPVDTKAQPQQADYDTARKVAETPRVERLSAPETTTVKATAKTTVKATTTTGGKTTTTTGGSTTTAPGTTTTAPKSETSTTTTTTGGSTTVAPTTAPKTENPVAVAPTTVAPTTVAPTTDPRTQVAAPEATIPAITTTPPTTTTTTTTPAN